MNLAESTIMNAIRYSMSKNCYANIVLAGPIGVGKRNMATVIADWLNAVTFEKTVSVFSQEDYLREFSCLVTDKFGGKPIDTTGAYEIKRYLSDAEAFINEEYEYFKIPRDAEKPAEKIEHIYGLQPKGKVKIFTGPHAIYLFKHFGIKIPNAIYIFMNANVRSCIHRRIQNGIMVPSILKASKDWKEYFDYVVAENEKYILPQMNMADIVVNVNL